MSKGLPTLYKLVSQLQRIPYLASKNIYKVAGYFLESSPDEILRLTSILQEVKAKISLCTTCFNWAEGNTLCSICLDQGRNKSVLCVVETWHDLIAIERAQEFKGVYHVLGGVLSPLNGVGPDELRIKELLIRLDGSVKEVIFATNPTPEGEATASFISTKFSDALIVSKLASGMPTGSSLEYIDRVTINKALAGRRPF